MSTYKRGREGKRTDVERLVTIIDEAFGLQPVQPVDDLLTFLERKLFEDRQAYNAVRAERDALMKLVDTLGAGPCPDRDRFMAILKQAMAAEVIAPALVDSNRCPKCSWPFAESAKDGCVPGNCSYREKR